MVPESGGEDPAVVVERRSGGGIGVFVLGVVIGAGLALLYAPDAGPVTRRKVARGARRLRRKARDLAAQAQDTAQDVAQDVARSTREALERRLERHHGKHRASRDELYDGEDEGV